MRVIAGSARGRRLKELEGSDTRPTTDRVKESLFSIIQFDIEGREVLDVFGGTGQLAIESLSRGATHATILDMRRDAVSLIRENLKATGLEEKATVTQGDSLEFLVKTKNKFDLIFLDPPYHTDLLENALLAIEKFDILNEHGIIVCESAVGKEFPTINLPYEQGKTYRYGQIQLTIYRRQGRGFTL